MSIFDGISLQNWERARELSASRWRDFMCEGVVRYKEPHIHHSDAFSLSLTTLKPTVNNPQNNPTHNHTVYSMPRKFK